MRWDFMPREGYMTVGLFCARLNVCSFSSFRLFCVYHVEVFFAVLELLCFCLF